MNAVMNSAALTTWRDDSGPDRNLLRQRIEGLGLACGELLLLPPNSKRVVMSDREYVVARAQREADPTLREPANELEWAARFSLAVPVQAPLHRHPILTVDGWLVTLWQYLPGKQKQTVGDARAHGALIRAIHDQVSIPPTANPVDPLAVASIRTASLASVGAPFAEALGAHLAVASRVLATASGALVASHGDVNPNTVLAGPRGAVLMDFDSSGAAPRMLDVGSGAYTYRRYLSAEHAAAFVAGYGAEPSDPQIAIHGWIRALRIAVARAFAGKDPTADLAWLAANSPSV
jgi:aminoglycoside phosphotransferase